MTPHEVAVELSGSWMVWQGKKGYHVCELSGTLLAQDNLGLPLSLANCIWRQN